MIAKRGHIPVGYYKDEEKTAATFKVFNGVRYAIPGDYARVESDGTVTMLGRGSVSINTGGEKVYPEEVEAALKGHPDVFDALVVGVPDERYGQCVAAVIAPRSGAPSLAERPRQLRAVGDRRVQGAAGAVAGRRGKANAGRQTRLSMGQRTNRGASGRRSQLKEGAHRVLKPLGVR